MKSSILKIEGNSYKELIKDVRDFAMVGDYIICSNQFAAPEVPDVGNEGGGYREEYSLNVYDLNGNFIKNLDKELYEKYDILAFPDSIAINSSGYGVMSGDFVYNHGKENWYGFSGMIIFKLVEGK